MATDPISRLCVGRLTKLLDLHSLEDLRILEEQGYASQNLDIEEHLPAASTSYQEEKTGISKQLKKLFKILAKKGW